MKDYMFFFRDCHPSTGGESADVRQAQMQKWSAWIEKLQKKGVFISGEPLEHDGKVVRQRGRQIIDGPFAEGKEVVGGYFVIKAKNIDEASELAKECPGFAFDNATVEVRPIMQIDM